MKKHHTKAILIAVGIWILFCFFANIHPVGGFFNVLSSILHTPLSLPLPIAIVGWILYMSDREEGEKETKT